MKNIKPLIVLVAAISVSMAALAQKHPQHKDPILTHSNELNLSADQSTRLNRLQQNHKAAIKSVRNNDGLSQAEKQQRMKSLHTKYRDSSFALLSPEQFAQLKTLRQDSTHHDMQNMPKQDLSKKLNMSQVQSEKLQAMQEKTQQEMQQIQQDSSITEANKKLRMKQLKKQQRQELQTLLTPDQQRRYKEMQTRKKNKDVKQ